VVVLWRRGQHWIILGPNGCGKTSLLKALTAYMTPTRGTIDLLGRRWQAWFPPHRRKVL
jgi:iron complex transport system ATP-binding protein